MLNDVLQRINVNYSGLKIELASWKLKDVIFGVSVTLIREKESVLVTVFWFIDK